MKTCKTCKTCKWYELFCDVPGTDFLMDNLREEDKE